MIHPTARKMRGGRPDLTFPATLMQSSTKRHAILKRASGSFSTIPEVS
jgi:hypothetical protein